jgi:plastocyanin domain-containing protein
VWSRPRMSMVCSAEVIGGEYYFDPNYIVVKVNKPVEMMVKRASGYISQNMEVKSPEFARDAALPVSGMARIPDPA